MKRKKQSQKKEIVWNIINSFLAAGLVFLGALSSGNINYNGIIAALVAGGVVALTKFRDYWAKEEHEYSKKIFKFI